MSTLTDRIQYHHRLAHDIVIQHWTHGTCFDLILAFHEIMWHAVVSIANESSSLYDGEWHSLRVPWIDELRAKFRVHRPLVPNYCYYYIHVFFSLARSISFEMRAVFGVHCPKLNLNNSYGKTEHVRQKCCNRLNLANKLISIIIITTIIIMNHEWAVSALSCTIEWLKYMVREAAKIKWRIFDNLQSVFTTTPLTTV